MTFAAIQPPNSFTSDNLLKSRAAGLDCRALPYDIQ